MRPSRAISFIVVLLLLLLAVLAERKVISISPRPEARAETPIALVRSELKNANEANRPAVDSLSNPEEAVSSKEFSPERIYCRILQANTGLPLEGRLKMYSFNYSADEEGTAGFVAYIQSSECPQGLFSKIRIDEFGRVRELIDCRSASQEEIFTKSGMQGNIENFPMTTAKLSLGLSGPGYFLMDCPDGLRMQRSGDFQRRGDEVWQGSCRVLDRERKPFLWSGEALDHRGCTEASVCPAVVEAEVSKVKFIDRTTYRVLDGVEVQDQSDVLIFSHSLEKLDDPDSGPTGPSWERRPFFDPPAYCQDSN